MSNMQDILLRVEPTRRLSREEWARVRDYLESKGLSTQFRVPLAPKDEGVGPKPKATVEEINQRALNNLHKAVKDGDVEDAQSWAGLLAVLN